MSRKTNIDDSVVNSITAEINDVLDGHSVANCLVALGAVIGSIIGNIHEQGLDARAIIGDWLKDLSHFVYNMDVLDDDVSAN